MKYIFNTRAWIIGIYVAFVVNFHNLLGSLGIDLPWIIKALLLILSLVGILFLLRWIEREEQHHFIEGKDDFYDFFYTWYQQPGRLSIFCSDLAWMEDEKSQRIATALKTKGRKAAVYLKDMNSPYVQELMDRKVKIFAVNKDVNCKFRFSIMEYQGKEKIIIRTRDKSKKQGIKFIETNSDKDPHVITLAKDLLDYCIKN
ncbi:hypothetical protein [Mucilaginibacter dorajii]|uniref:Uncharacterized protein n=1 Tax=Mucilaginibacter dorajii TaxID=692994 RepID=A0ABP7QXZ6_9SPHI|nr:hypothetical protein [Mucilaginibacter dorajii]MCS3732356.1 hypothetical protein [Mucilaginibacter dorajii]